MATQIKISELPLANEDALSVATDDRFIFNNDNVNTQTIKFGNLVDAITAQNLVFNGTCQFNQSLVGPNGGDLVVDLDKIGDVTVTNVQSGQLLQYNGADWVNVDAESVTGSTIGELTDVMLASVADENLLQYDAATGMWKNVTASSVARIVPFATEDDAKANGYNEGDAYFNTSFSKTLVVGGSQIPSKKAADDASSGEVYYDQAMMKVVVKNNYTSTQVDALLNAKANVADVYTQTQVDNAIADFIELTDLSVTTGAVNGNGSLTYNNLTGQFTFQGADLSALAPADVLNDAVLTGDPVAPTPVAGNSSTAIATTAFVSNAVTTNNSSYISIADLQTLVANAADYAAFQTAIAAL